MRNDKCNWAPQGEYLPLVVYEGATYISATPIGHLKHEPTGYSLAVYKPISRFKRLMLRLCFGLKYEKI